MSWPIQATDVQLSGLTRPDSAGSRDSPLTSHGVLQARRLGEHLAARSPSTGPVLHIFASDLQRAAHTAQAIVDAQLAMETDSPGHRAPLAVVELADLRERDFGSAEGVKFGSLPASGSIYNPHPDAETRPEMHARVDRFIELHLAPLFRDLEPTLGTASGAVVIVAHGIILNVLLKALLSRFAPAELDRLTNAGSRSTEYLASWSNTGFAEVVIHSEMLGESAGLVGIDVEDSGKTVMATTTTLRLQSSIGLTVTVMNSVEHLQGLKRTRGGIGSAKFDGKQKTVDSFFKPTGKKQG